MEPMRQGLAEGAESERWLADLVNEAYGLTTEEVDLLWRTAPPLSSDTAPDADPTS